MNTILNMQKVKICLKTPKKVDNNIILEDISIQLDVGKNYVLAGQNGSGKSSMFLAIMDHYKYEIADGQIDFNNQNLLKLDTSDRARLGIYLSLQQSVEIEGLSIMQFLKYAMTNFMERTKLSAMEFFKEVAEGFQFLNIPDEWRTRSINVGFSGGEKKRLELLQLFLLRPKLVLLDEIDSGVDANLMLDIVKIIELLNKENNTAFFIISHQKNLLDKLNIEKVFLLENQTVKRSGDKTLLEEIYNRK
ncbi:MAG: Fe-S cluster assembly ATPase SufC [Alphaproteobacteria bacterium]|nr:Fe-S cluster assembly ATPase SufC [Alphaproteobacteria bacterium]MBL0717972.1 Fe-S cluster assembly ATPase SufC [Alphaproteobacteria bacterium]